MGCRIIPQYLSTLVAGSLSIYIGCRRMVGSVEPRDSMNRLIVLVCLFFVLTGFTGGFLWQHIRRSEACPVHPCNCHVEYSHCVKECPSEGATKKYAACCRLHCLATLQQEIAK